MSKMTEAEKKLAYMRHLEKQSKVALDVIRGVAGVRPKESANLKVTTAITSRS